jgi:aminoglycoside phosphotransferase (APT) family kinase protein
MGAEPGRLIGSGRAADVYDIGNSRVLRRYRDSIPAAAAAATVVREAAVMRHVQSHGFPTPEVFDADGRDLVMARLDGVTMLADMESHPWRVHRHADAMASLHRRLVAVPVGELSVPGGPLNAPYGAPEAIVHLDFHPGNVMLTTDGPVLFDWTNAVLGPPAADVAYAWVIGATSNLDGPWWIRVLGERLRRRFVDRFVDGCGRAAAIELLPVMGAHRLADRNTFPEEAVRVRQLVAHYS